MRVFTTDWAISSMALLESDVVGFCKGCVSADTAVELRELNTPTRRNGEILPIRPEAIRDKTEALEDLHRETGLHVVDPSDKN